MKKTAVFQSQFFFLSFFEICLLDFFNLKPAEICFPNLTFLVQLKLFQLLFQPLVVKVFFSYFLFYLVGFLAKIGIQNFQMF